MPDITMCLNKDCLKKLTCWRFTAKPNEFRQSFANFKPDETGNCNHYWTIRIEKMKTNQLGIELIKKFEGFSDVIYLCPAGKDTIGYGHLIVPTDYFHEPITEEVAEELLRSDLEKAEKAVSKYITAYLNENQFSALVSFTFNLGAGALKESTLALKLNDGDYISTPEQLNRWVFADGQRQRGLELRRKAEADLFQLPVG